MEEISLGKATKQESNVPQKSEVVKADTDDKLRELAQKATNNSELLDWNDLTYTESEIVTIEVTNRYLDERIS